MAKKKRKSSRQKSLGTISLDALQQELQRRASKTASVLQRLQGKRDRLRDQLAELEAEIIELGGKLTGLGGRKRPKNDANLADSLAKVLRTQTMSVTDVAEEVQHAGYKTTSPNFRTIVNQTLIKDPRFKRVSRGQYTTK